MDTTHQYDQPPAPPQPSGSDSFFSSLRRAGIWRTEDRWVGGVAAGTAHRLGVDPILVRGILVVMSFFGGLGLLLYGAGWALLPEARDGRIHLQEAVRGRFDAALAGAVALFVVGISRPIFWWDLPGAGWVLWALALAGLVAVVAVTAGKRSGAPHDGGANPGWAPPPPPTAHAGTGTPVDAAAASTPSDAPRPAYDPGPTPPPEPVRTSEPWRAGDTAAFAYDGAAPPPPVTTPLPPPPPPRPRVPGPSSRTVSLVLALCLLAGAGLLLAHYTGTLDGTVFLVIGGSVLTLLGLGVVVSGIQGRRQGVLGGLAVLVALIMVPPAAAVAALPGLDGLGLPGNTTTGSPRFAPESADEASQGYTLGAGELTVDLTGLSDSGPVDIDVPVELGLGVARIVVPDDADVVVRAQLGGGEILGPLGSGWTRTDTSGGSAATGTGRSLASGAGLDVALSAEGDGSPAAPTITVDVEVGFGQIVIEERS